MRSLFHECRPCARVQLKFALQLGRLKGLWCIKEEGSMTLSPELEFPSLGSVYNDWRWSESLLGFIFDKVVKNIIAISCWNEAGDIFKSHVLHPGIQSSGVSRGTDPLLMSSLYTKQPMYPHALGVKNTTGIRNSSAMLRVKLVQPLETMQDNGGTPEDGALSLFKRSQKGAFYVFPNSGAKRRNILIYVRVRRRETIRNCINWKLSDPSRAEGPLAVRIHL